jgi:hypothetical protein
MQSLTDLLLLNTVLVLYYKSQCRLHTVLFCHRYRDQIPVGVRFFAHVQTGPGAHPAYCTVGTGSFPGVKWPGCGADHPPPSSAEVTKG